MSAEKGRSGVVREAVGAAAAEAEELAGDQGGGQLAMFEAPTRFDGEKAIETRRKIEEHHRARGGGRPGGAQNLATRQLREYLLQRGRSPLENLMRWSLHTPETLAKELDCTKLEAFDRLRAVWSDLGPYLHSRMAPVDAKGDAVVPLFQMILGGAGLGADGAQLPPWLLDAEVAKRIEKDKQLQIDSDAADEVSHEESRTNDTSD